MAHFLNPQSGEAYGTLTLAPGQSEEIGLWGGGPNGEDLVISSTDESVVEIHQKRGLQQVVVFAHAGHTRRVTLIAKRRPGAQASIEARLGEGGPVWAIMKVAVQGLDVNEELLSEVDPNAYRNDPGYLDKVTAGHYDVYSGSFWVDHWLGIEIDLDYGKILENTKRGRVTMYTFYRDRQTKIIFPRVVDHITAPNITDLVLQTEEAFPAAKSLGILGVELLTNPWLSLSWTRVGSLRRYGSPRAPKGPQVKVPYRDRTNLLIPERNLKVFVLAKWASGGENGLVKVVSKIRGSSAVVRGYVTQAKFVTGKAPEEMERLLGLSKNELKDGAYVIRVANPQIDQFSLRSYTNLPAGEVYVPGVNDSRWPPGLGAPQWELTTEVTTTGSTFVPPGGTYRP